MLKIQERELVIISAACGSYLFTLQRGNEVNEIAILNMSTCIYNKHNVIIVNDCDNRNGVHARTLYCVQLRQITRVGSTHSACMQEYKEGMKSICKLALCPLETNHRVILPVSDHVRQHAT